MNPEDNFDEIFPTEKEGIYEYYDEVLIDYNAFKRHESELLDLQLTHPEYDFHFIGFWSSKSEDELTRKFDNPYNIEYENAKFRHRVDLYHKGYKFIMDELLELYPQFSDIFVGSVED